ncbi:Thioredoxin-like protein 1 [Orchesella cincta]|uniref:Thioredoxin-like protein 1 n=1 Tax=Orchesella cincta TaxID=48709 RepID=A0A1D2MBF7_ORCCI|nr:Thioredoxin-like protein 1 [Orchesella cincta]
MSRLRGNPSAAGIRVAGSDQELDALLRGVGAEKLLIIYFYLPWCGSCQKINPTVDALADKYEQAVFIRVNAEKCPAASKKHHVSKVPIFLLFNNRVKVDRVEGASPSELDSKIRRNLAEIKFQQGGFNPPVAPLPHSFKMTDVSQFLNKQQCRCINDLIPTPFQAFLDGKKLVSGKGLGRMILVYAFREKMVITGLKIKAPVYSGPKILRFFVNLHKVLDFAVVSQMSSTQELSLTEPDLSGEHTVELRSGGLVGVENLQIYIPENMTKNRKTEIEFLTLIGAPMSLTTFANIDSSAIATTKSMSVSANAEDILGAAGPSKRTTADAYT